MFTKKLNLKWPKYILDHQIELGQNSPTVLIRVFVNRISFHSNQIALESKRSKLEEQTREAEFLHQNTDRRRRVIRKMLAKYLNDVELEQVGQKSWTVLEKNLEIDSFWVWSSRYK